MKYRIGIIGVGYVGLPLINAFAKKDYYVKAYDINSKRINQLLKNIDLRIIHIIPSYIPLIGGAERQLGRLSKIQSIENEVIIITRNLVNKNPLYRKKINQKLEILRFGFGDLISYNIILFFYLFLNRPKFLHIHTLTSPFFISCICAFLFKSKIIAKITRYGVGSQIELITKSFIKLYIFKSFCRSKTIFICLTKECVKYVNDLNLNLNLQLIPNGIIPTNNTINKKIINDKLKLVIISRLIPRKRVLTSVKSLIKTFNNQIDIHICGDGIEKIKIEDYKKKYNISNIYLHGFINEKKVFDILSKSNFLILNSINEGLSNSFLEALNNAVIPVVDFNDFYRYLNEKYGCILSFDKMLDMKAEELKKYYNDNFTSLKKIVKTEFDLKKINKAYIKLYDE